MGEGGYEALCMPGVCKYNMYMSRVDPLGNGGLVGGKNAIVGSRENVECTLDVASVYKLNCV